MKRASLLLEWLDARDLLATLPSPSFPLADTFVLHSRPEAAKVIFLDFDGHVRNAGTAQQMVIGPYNPAGDASFNAGEREVIQRAFLRVAEDFSPFDVDVTTQDPGVEALRYTGTADTRWGVRVQVGNADPTDGRTGAWASVDAFQTGSADARAYVYMGTSTNDRQMHAFITHEVGHVLGLDHDGRTSPVQEYANGHLTPTGTRWSSNMGVSFGYEVLDQWDKGEYANASNAEDDLAVITRAANFGYRPDDVGGTPKPLAESAGGALTGAGVIERNTDTDGFSFTLARATDVQLTVDPAALGANLDVLARLYSSTGLVATGDPAATLSASFKVTLPAGTYTVQVDGTGQGDPRTNGYSDYGSLGQYTVQATLKAPGALNLANGVYQFGNAKSRLALSAPATAAAGAQVTQAAATGASQQWDVQAVGGGYHTVTHVATGLRLDNAGSSASAGGRVILWPAHGGDNQLWYFRAAAGGRVEVVNKHSGLVLDVSGGSTAAGAPVVQWSAHGGANQRWGVAPVTPGPVADGTYTLANSASGLAADNPGGSYAAGTELIQYRLSGTAGAANQQWVVRSAADGYVTVANVRSGQLVTGGGTVVQRPAADGTPGDDQLWALIPLAGGGRAIVNKATGLALDVSGASTSSGAKLVTSPFDGAASQTWNLARV